MQVDRSAKLFVWLGEGRQQNGDRILIRNLIYQDLLWRAAILKIFFFVLFKLLPIYIFSVFAFVLLGYNKIELREITAVSQQTIPLYQYQEGIFGLKSSEKGKQKWRMKEIKSFEFLDT